MKKEGLYDKHAYQIVLTLLPTLAGMILIYDLLNVHFNEIALGILILLCILVVRFLDYYKAYVAVKITILSLALFIVGVVVYNLETFINLKNKLLLVADGSLHSNEFSIPEMLVLTLILILLCTIPLYLVQKYKIVRVVFATVTLIFLLYQAVNGDVLHLYAIALILIYIFLVLGELLVARYLPNGKKGSKQIMLHLVPLMLLYLVLVANMPVSNKPITLHETVVSGIESTVSRWYSEIRYWLAPDQGEYGVSMIGYSEDEGFDGIDGSDDSISLKVYSKNPLGQPVYLRGNWKNIYTGQNWEEKMEDTDIYSGYSEVSLDWTELLYSLYRYDNLDSLEQLVRIDNMDVLFKDIETSSIFLPLKTTNIQAGMSLNTSTPNNLNYETLKHEGTQYSFSTLKLNYQSQRWKDFTSQAQNYTYSSLQKVDMTEFRKRIRDYGIRIGLDCYFSDEDILSKRASYIKDQFTKVPEELPKRVGDLTKKITEGCNTSLEKCEAIKSYLKTYQYTLKPKKIKEGTDLVDSFLFDTREGYCTYFASAMAVMVRTLGIPSRFAQGFVVSTGLNPNSKYEVKSSSAHAWVEVYIEGIGWLNFDPTPSSEVGIAESYNWDDSELVVSQNDKQETDGVKIDNEALQAYYDSLIKDKEEKKEEEAKSYKLLETVVIFLIGIAMFGLLIGIAYVVIIILLNRRRIRKKCSNDSLYVTMAQIFFLLEALEIPIEDTETIHQYFVRIKKEWNNQRMFHKELDEIQNIYSSVRYSNRVVQGEELHKVIDFRKDLLNKYKQNRSRFNYFILWLKFSMYTFK